MNDESPDRQRIVILGTGGFAKEVRWLIEELDWTTAPRLEFAGYVAVDTRHHDMGAQVSPTRADLRGDLGWLFEHRHEFDALALGVRSGSARYELASELEATFGPSYWPTIVHPTVRYDASTLEIGHGVTMFANTIATVDLVIEPFVGVHIGCTLGHDVVLGKGSMIDTRADIAGNVRVGRGVHIGARALILEHVSLGNGSIVGAGIVVEADVEPAVAIRRSTEGAPAMLTAIEQFGAERFSRPTTDRPRLDDPSAIEGRPPS